MMVKVFSDILVLDRVSVIIKLRNRLLNRLVLKTEFSHISKTKL